MRSVRIFLSPQDCCGLRDDGSIEFVEFGRPDRILAEHGWSQETGRRRWRRAQRTRRLKKTISWAA